MTIERIAQGYSVNPHYGEPGTIAPLKNAGSYQWSYVRPERYPTDWAPFLIEPGIVIDPAAIEIVMKRGRGS